MKKVEIIRDIPAWAFKVLGNGTTVNKDAGDISVMMLYESILKYSMDFLEQVRDSANAIDKIYPDHKVELKTKFGELEHDFGKFEFQITKDRLILLPKEGCNSVGGHFHPHLNNDGSACLGEAKDRWRQMIISGYYFEALLMGLEILKTYNPKSPYAQYAYFLVNDIGLCHCCRATISEEVRKIPEEYRQDLRASITCKKCGAHICPNCSSKDDEGNIYCKNCVISCYWCEKIVKPSEALVTWDGRAICKQCFETESRARCANCGSPLGRGYVCEKCGGNICLACYEHGRNSKCYKCTYGHIRTEKYFCSNCRAEKELYEMVRCPNCSDIVCKDCYNIETHRCKKCTTPIR